MGESLYNIEYCISKLVLIQHILCTQVSNIEPIVFWFLLLLHSTFAVLETAGRIVIKCDQTLVWARKFIPKDRPENDFGGPNLWPGYHMFSAYLWLISMINFFKTAQRTLGNNIIFLLKDAAIILTGLLRFSATCCLILFSTKYFRELDLLYIKVSECTEMK